VATSQLSPRSQPASLTLPPSLSTVACSTTGTRWCEFDPRRGGQVLAAAQPSPRCAGPACLAVLPFPYLLHKSAQSFSLHWGLAVPCCALPSYQPVQQSHYSLWHGAPPTLKTKTRPLLPAATDLLPLPLLYCTTPCAVRQGCPALHIEPYANACLRHQLPTASCPQPSVLTFYGASAPETPGKCRFYILLTLLLQMPDGPHHPHPMCLSPSSCYPKLECPCLATTASCATPSSPAADTPSWGCPCPCMATTASCPGHKFSTSKARMLFLHLLFKTEEPREQEDLPPCISMPCSTQPCSTQPCLSTP